VIGMDVLLENTQKMRTIKPIAFSSDCHGALGQGAECANTATGRV